MKKKKKGIHMHYLGKMNKSAVQFMEFLLKMDPKERPTAFLALRHPYFKGLNKEFLQKPKSSRSR